MRRKNARMIAEDLHEAAYFLIDDLGEGLELKGVSQPANDPVWCSYGPGARLSVLVNSDGTSYNTQAWFHSVTMAVAIEELLLMRDKLASQASSRTSAIDAGIEEAFSSNSSADATEAASRPRPRRPPSAPTPRARTRPRPRTRTRARRRRRARPRTRATWAARPPRRPRPTSEVVAADAAAAEAAAAGLEGTEAATLYANYKPALTISDEQLSTMLDRDHPAERMKALSQIRHFTIKYAKFRSNKLSSRHEQGLPPPKSQAQRAHAAEKAEADASERREAAASETDLAARAARAARAAARRARSPRSAAAAASSSRRGRVRSRSPCSPPCASCARGDPACRRTRRPPRCCERRARSRVARARARASLCRVVQSRVRVACWPRRGSGS